MEGEHRGCHRGVDEGDYKKHLQCCGEFGIRQLHPQGDYGITRCGNNGQIQHHPDSSFNPEFPAFHGILLSRNEGALGSRLCCESEGVGKETGHALGPFATFLVRAGLSCSPAPSLRPRFRPTWGYLYPPLQPAATSPAPPARCSSTGPWVPSLREECLPSSASLAPEPFPSASEEAGGLLPSLPHPSRARRSL